jgi:hypothetical protein
MVVCGNQTWFWYLYCVPCYSLQNYVCYYSQTVRVNIKTNKNSIALSPQANYSD